MAASCDFSPFKGNVWDPDDDEWADVDANRVVETFKASFKDPGQYSPRKAGALTRLGSTIISFFPSTSRSQMREEEEVRDKLEELGNTWYCDPEGDLCDEVMKGVFVSGSKFFDGRVSARCMHVVNLEAYFKAEDPLLEQAKPRLCDAVATILSHTSKECLEAFLNPSIGEFAYRRELDRNKAGTVLIVRRKGNKVFAGAYRNLGFRLQWTLYVKSLVSITGQWHEAYATLKPGSTPIVSGIPAWGSFAPEDDQPKGAQDGAKPEEGSPRKIELSSPKKKQEHDDLSPESPKFMLYQSRLLAKYLLWDIWVRFDSLYECRATWEADGVVTGVRLKRTLVGVGEEDEE